MRSRAAIGNHPLQPALVPVPIGAFFMALVGDVAYSADPGTGFWYDLSFVCIGIGIVAALLAAAARLNIVHSPPRKKERAAS